MENFSVYNPTRLHFGKGCVSEKLAQEASVWGKRALILIGKGSVKKNGILDDVTRQLDQAGIAYEVFEGIKSNPIYQDADRAIAQSKAFKADMIIGVGGGSVIDTAKAVALGHYSNASIWDIYMRQVEAPAQALPLLCVLTLAATGTEMNMFAVLQNDEARIKKGFGHPGMYPKVSFLDPAYTLSVPLNYTAYGVADLMAHTFELYFDPSDAPLSNYFATDIIALAFDYGRAVIQKPQDYDVRANIMWLATTALNGTLNAGKRGGDWGVHAIEHALSVLFDIPHGAGLSIAYPAWLRHFLPKIKDKLTFMAERTLGKGTTAEAFIDYLENFFKEIGTPIRLSEVGIGEDKHPLILEVFKQNRVRGMHFDMNEEDHKAILQLMA